MCATVLTGGVLRAVWRVLKCPQTRGYLGQSPMMGRFQADENAPGKAAMMGERCHFSVLSDITA